MGGRRTSTPRGVGLQVRAAAAFVERAEGTERRLGTRKCNGALAAPPQGVTADPFTVSGGPTGGARGRKAESRPRRHVDVAQPIPEASSEGLPEAESAGGFERTLTAPPSLPAMVGLPRWEKRFL